MYWVTVEFNDGSEQEKEVNSLQAACNWVMYKRGVEQVLIEKLVDAPGKDLEDEVHDLLAS